LNRGGLRRPDYLNLKETLIAMSIQAEKSSTDRQTEPAPKMVGADVKGMKPAGKSMKGDSVPF